MTEVPNCFYRVSVKALVLNETKDKFLICREENGDWELPGGGLDWGATPQEDLPREIEEEMGLPVSSVAQYPSYFLTDQKKTNGLWIVNVVYEVAVGHLKFVPSEECQEIMFVNKHDLEGMNALTNVVKLAEMFDSERHK